MSIDAMPLFNPLQYANSLKAAGVSAEQAEAHATALVSVLDAQFDRFATKDDLKILAAELRGEIAPLRWMCGTTVLGVFGTFIAVIAMALKVLT